MTHAQFRPVPDPRPHCRTARSPSWPRYLGRLIATLALFLVGLLAPVPADATPSPAVITHDHLLGANDRSFFVLRTTTIYPGSYYQFTRRLEFLEISVWDGSKRRGCLMRETTSTEDPATDPVDWSHSDAPTAPCTPAQRLRDAGAQYTLPTPIGPPPYALTLTDQSVQIRRGIGTDPARLLDWAYIDSRARAMGQVGGVDFLWQQTGAQTVCPYCEATEGLPATQACELDPAATDVPFAPWVFLRLTCWDGSSDISGAVFFIPVSQSTYQDPGTQ